jgi:hypothetical protein
LQVVGVEFDVVDVKVQEKCNLMKAHFSELQHDLEFINQWKVLLYIRSCIQDGTIKHSNGGVRPPPSSMRITAQVMGWFKDRATTEMLQDELMTPVGITVVTDPAAALQLCAEGKGTRLHTYPTNTLPAQLSDQHEVWLKISPEFNATALERKMQQLNAHREGGLYRQAQVIVFNQVLSPLYIALSSAEGDLIATKLQTYFTSQGQSDLIAHVQCFKLVSSFTGTDLMTWEYGVRACDVYC